MCPIGSQEDRPLIVIWEVTQSCALACRHCRAEARPRSHPSELTPRQSEDLIDQVAQIAPRYFILTGGDPASRPDILSLIARANARGLRVAISPSATPRLLSMDFDALRKAGVRRMSLSLDGAAAATHDRFRGQKGAWGWTMDALAAARRARISLQINTTFSRSNFDEWPDFVRLIERLRPALWNAFFLVPTGRGSLKEVLLPAEAEALLQGLTAFPAATGIPVKTTEAPSFRRVAIQSRANLGPGGKPWRIAPTNDGRGCVFVSHLGEIQPSGFLPISCGNVKTHNLLDVYREATVFQNLRNPNLLKGKCGLCEFRIICGGSRARAHAVTGDYLAEEPTCIYQPKGAIAGEWAATLQP
jgi:radical SAM protein with 4Fe4S-binding SPASM domain